MQRYMLSNVVRRMRVPPRSAVAFSSYAGNITVGSISVWETGYNETIIKSDWPPSSWIGDHNHNETRRLTHQFIGSFVQIHQYSGGQATEGQGGYYGSGGARVLDNPTNTESVTHDLLALSADVDKVTSVMQDLHGLETLLDGESADGISGKNIEYRNNIKKLMTTGDFLESLSRLEVKGEPAWGLSESEREMIIFAREKVNSS
eukprot:CAMPEP_0119002794 /NCGR_PEP_ID=MMETSP1176-20130426/131_1 /TAXON_ID=265551 /ORGANISM="Synedropsis recta cf, Strain CCMP1620" /LENGTH=203 /DNA_ID=CAMNT_0006954319 /DNA_START=121 /DNA_END=733 /DNA_ORIENTATION=-